MVCPKTSQKECAKEMNEELTKKYHVLIILRTSPAEHIIVRSQSTGEATPAQE